MMNLTLKLASFGFELTNEGCLSHAAGSLVSGHDYRIFALPGNTYNSRRNERLGRPIRWQMFSHEWLYNDAGDEVYDITDTHMLTDIEMNEWIAEHAKKFILNER